MKIISIILLFFSLSLAQEQTVGLFLNSDQAFPGYTLFAPNRSSTTYLIDNNGEMVHSWPSTITPGMSVYLLKDGNLLRTEVEKNTYIDTGGAGGKVLKMDWDGNIIWQFIYSDSLHRQHHDVQPLPNGNVLLIAWELKSKEETVEAGRDSNMIKDGKLWPDHLIEVQPLSKDSSRIVWEWHAWDHLIQDFDSSKANYGVVEAHPELIDINFSARAPKKIGHADWLHINAVNYNPELDQIVLSVHAFSEIWIIDHSTTTEEAAGHSGGNRGRGGDLLYRWGNPEAFRAGTSADRTLFNQHDAHWIPAGLPDAGDMLIFNNGSTRPDSIYSTVDEIATPMADPGNYIHPDSGQAFGPEDLIWRYKAPNPLDFYGRNISGSQRQPNGNTLICVGPHGKFFEVDSSGTIVWEYVNPVVAGGPLAQGDSIPGTSKGDENAVFRCYRYAADYPGLAGKDLTPIGPIEITDIEDGLKIKPGTFALFQNYPNPFNPSTAIRYHLSVAGKVRLSVYNALGQVVRELVHRKQGPGAYSVTFDGSALASGVYFYTLTTDRGFIAVRKMLLIK